MSEILDMRGDVWNVKLKRSRLLFSYVPHSVSILSHLSFTLTSLIVFSLLFVPFSTKAQFYNLPNDYFFNTLSQRHLAKIDSEQIHTSIQPYIPFFNKKYEFVNDSHRVFKYITDDVALEKVFFDHLIHIKSKNGNYEFKVNPLLNIEFGRS